MPKRKVHEHAWCSWVWSEGLGQYLRDCHTCPARMYAPELKPVRVGGRPAYTLTNRNPWRGIGETVIVAQKR